MTYDNRPDLDEKRDFNRALLKVCIPIVIVLIALSALRF